MGCASQLRDVDASQQLMALREVLQMIENPADPLHVGNTGLPALNDAELEVLIEIGAAGGMWPRHQLDAAAVKALLDAALLWPKGHSAVALTAKGIQVLAAAAKAATGDA
jgi:hypothetical protein